MSHQEKISCVIYHINESFTETGSMKPTLRRELIKMMAKLAEIFEGELLLQLPKVVSFF